MLVVSVYALRQPEHGSSAQAGSATSTATHVATSAASPASHTSAPRSSSSGPSDGRLPLVVLNNTTVTGLAQQAEDTFRAGGWQVTSIGNLRNDIISTCAYYDPAASGARTAAAMLMRQFPAIKRTAPKFDGLPAGPVVVVLTPDYTSG